MIYDFEIYCGKKSNATTALSTTTNLGVTGDLVMRLCQNLLPHLHYKVYFDNCFTSIPLLKQLSAKRILVLGTIKQNRMLGAQNVLTTEKDLKGKGRGSRNWRMDVNSNIVLLKWLVNIVVHLAFNFADSSVGEHVRRRSAKEKKKKYIDIGCPAMVHLYNKFMGGVDLNDMLLSLYHIKLGTRKWYMQIFFYLVKVAVTNGWLLYRRHIREFYSPNAPYMPLLEFRAQVANGLTQAGKLPAQATAKRGPRPSSFSLPAKKSKTNAILQNDIRYDGCGHYAVFVDKQHRCRLCSKG